MPVIWDIWISHLHRSRKWNSNSLGLERLGKGSPCLMVWRLILCVTLLGCSEIWSSITLGASVRVFGGNINIWTGRPSKADSLPWTGLVTPVEGLHRATPAWLTCSSVSTFLTTGNLNCTGGSSTWTDTASGHSWLFFPIPPYLGVNWFLCYLHR